MSDDQTLNQSFDDRILESMPRKSNEMLTPTDSGPRQMKQRNKIIYTCPSNYDPNKNLIPNTLIMGKLEMNKGKIESSLENTFEA